MKAVVIATLLAASLAHAAPSSTVTPPIGWTEDTSGAGLSNLKDKPGIVRSGVRQWNAPDGSAAFQVIEIEMTMEGTNARTMLAAMEDGVKRGMGPAREVSAPNRREHGDAIVVDHVIEKSERRIHLQRHYAVDLDDHLHSATLSCISALGPEDAPACAPAFASFRWTFKPEYFPTSTASGLAYTAGKLLGYFGIATVVVLLVLEPSRRKRKRERAARDAVINGR